MEQIKQEFKAKSWYDKNYKIMFIIPIIILILSLIYLYSFYQANNDIIKRDISLKGGTTLTIYSQINTAELKQYLAEKYLDFNVREISDLRTGEQLAVIVEVTEPPEIIQQDLESYLNLELTDENSSIEFTGSVLSEGFYQQLRTAIILAFILMSLAVFILFRTFVPSAAVILSAFADITMSLAFVDILGIKLSAAGIVAFLMLIGYSVDSDILLTTRVLKRRDEKLNKRIYSAFKTGITMTLTSLAAVIVSLLIVKNLSQTLAQIFLILTIGLSFDIVNTWFANASILKWYAEKKRIE